MPESHSSSSRTPFTAEYIQQSHEHTLEIEFTLNHVDDLAVSFAALSRDDQDLLLGWVRRIATTNTHLAHQFAIRAMPQFKQRAEQDQTDTRMIDAWALHTMDAHDQGGACPAFQVVDEVGKLPFKVANIYRRLTI